MGREMLDPEGVFWERLCADGLPDAFTHLGIDRNNEWGLKPSLYSSKEVLAWDVGTLG